MASIPREPKGRRTIQSVGSDGKQRSIRLGRCDQRTAEAVKVRVELLNAAKVSGHAVDSDTLKWLSRIGDELADKVARAGLAPHRERAVLQGFLDGYLESRTDLKVRTRWKLRTPRDRLIAFFGAGKALREISPGHADEFRLHLVKEGLVEDSVRKHVAITKYRSGDVNLRTQPERIIRKAGLEPWGKPWQNCRSTRATELEGRFPSHVVRAWLGHSEAVAAVLLADYPRALPASPGAGTEALQNAVQQTPGGARNASQGKPEIPVSSRERDAMRLIAYPPVAAVGLEPTTRGL